MEQGICPECKSKSLIYETIVDITSSIQAIYYPVECLDCGYKGKEYYNLHFTEYVENK